MVLFFSPGEFLEKINKSIDKINEYVYIWCVKFIDICKYATDRGWKLARVTGSHYQFVKPGRRTVPVQKHSKEIVGAYLKRILKQLDS